jgi:hypothetical protein
MSKAELVEKIGFFGTKSLSISFLFVVQFVCTFPFVIVLNKIFKDFNPEQADKKNIIIILLEIIGQLVLVGVLTYVIRNITQLIPYPLEGVYGIETKRIKEFMSAPLVPFLLLFFFRNLKDKMIYISNRLNK